MDRPEEILRDPALRRQLAAHLDGEPGGMLRSLKVKLISTCNLRCVMCRYWRIPRRALPLDVVKGVLNDAAEMGCRKVHFSGGEVTLYPDLDAVMANRPGRGMRVNLTTNGVLVDRPRVRQWIAAGIAAASISLDGATAEVHDGIRGVAGAFEQSVKGARNLMRESERAGGRLRLRINTVVQRRNLAQQAEMVRLAAELGACDVIPMPVDGASADRPTAEEIRAYNRDLAPEVARLRLRHGMSVTPERIHPFGQTDEETALSARGDYALGYYDQHLCHAPWLHTFVSHLGDVFACCMTAERMPSLGNILRQRLAEIFAGEAYERFRREMLRERLAMCAHCDQFLPENRLLSEALGERALLAPLPQRRELPLVTAG